MRSPRLQALAKENSLEVAALTPAETRALLKEDRANAARIFKTLGVKPEDAPN
jgi:tripartite-type tricarboxylate transporter receptor subunit TctC